MQCPAVGTLALPEQFVNLGLAYAGGKMMARLLALGAIVTGLGCFVAGVVAPGHSGDYGKQAVEVGSCQMKFLYEKSDGDRR